MLLALTLRYMLIVLIDTWWNVNSYSTNVIEQHMHSFNRYMVECES